TAVKGKPAARRTEVGPARLRSENVSKSATADFKAPLTSLKVRLFGVQAINAVLHLPPIQSFGKCTKCQKNLAAVGRWRRGCCVSSPGCYGFSRRSAVHRR